MSTVWCSKAWYSAVQYRRLGLAGTCMLDCMCPHVLARHADMGFGARRGQYPRAPSYLSCLNSCQRCCIDPV